MQSGQKTKDTTSERSSIGASLTIGKGENGTLIIAPQAEGKLRINSKTHIECKVPVNIASGNLGSHTGIGDPVFTISHLFANNHRFTFNTTIGARVCVGSSNAADKGMALPMPYQSSLGTTDLIAGVGSSYGEYFSFSAGYQHPLWQYNKNSYQPAIVYPVTPGDHDYFASKELKRKGDVLLRAEAHYQWRKFSVSAGPLFIYHLGQDTYTTATGSRASLTGSGGVTLNIAASLSYNMKNANLTLLGGEPLVVRSYRPDGLTRSFVVTFRYTRFR
jgi:hypothetical protein